MAIEIRFRYSAAAPLRLMSAISLMASSYARLVAHYGPADDNSWQSWADSFAFSTPVFGSVWLLLNVYGCAFGCDRGNVLDCEG